MKILLAVMSCQRDALNGCHDVVRQTWLQYLKGKADFKFFVGRDDQIWTPPRFIKQTDEEVLDVDDGYHALPEKSREIRRWALGRGYDYIFKCDRDTYIVPDRLLSSGFERYDYVGHFASRPIRGVVRWEPDRRGMFAYASGGCGYWTSRRATELLAHAGIDGNALDTNGNPAEDLWAANVLGLGDVTAYHDDRYQFKGAELWSPAAVSVHLSCGTGNYVPMMMRFCHDKLYGR